MPSDVGEPLGRSPIVRRVDPEDARAYFEVRLEALESCPEAFASSAGAWRDVSLADVHDQLRAHTADRFMLGAFDGPRLVGTCGMFRQSSPKLAHKATVVAVYVDAEWRGRGVAGRMLDEIIRRARGVPGLRQLQLGVGAANLPALRLYESRGFAAFGTERAAMIVEGRTIDEVHMQLLLEEPLRPR